MKNLKEGLLAVITVGEKVDSSLEDGQINIPEGIAIGISMFGLYKVVKNADLIKEEFFALTDDEKIELGIWFSDEFDIRNDVVENIIELVVNSIIQFNDMFAAVLAGKNPV